MHPRELSVSIWSTPSLLVQQYYISKRWSPLNCIGKWLQGGPLMVLSHCLFKNLKVKLKRLSLQNAQAELCANGQCSQWESCWTPLNSSTFQSLMLEDFFCTFYVQNFMLPPKYTLQCLFQRQEVNFCYCQQSVSQQPDLDSCWSQNLLLPAP